MSLVCCFIPDCKKNMPMSPWFLIKGFIGSHDLNYQFIEERSMQRGY